VQCTVIMENRKGYLYPTNTTQWDRRVNHCSQMIKEGCQNELKVIRISAVAQGKRGPPPTAVTTAISEISFSKPKNDLIGSHFQVPPPKVLRDFWTVCVSHILSPVIVHYG
jgi:hypothetical protein